MTKLEKIIKNNALSRFTSRKTKEIFLPGFEGASLYDVLVFFNSQVQKIGLNDRARSIAFSFLMRGRQEKMKENLRKERKKRKIDF